VVEVVAVLLVQHPLQVLELLEDPEGGLLVVAQLQILVRQTHHRDKVRMVVMA